MQNIKKFYKIIVFLICFIILIIWYFQPRTRANLGKFDTLIKIGDTRQDTLTRLRSQSQSIFGSAYIQAFTCNGQNEIIDIFFWDSDDMYDAQIRSIHYESTGEVYVIKKFFYENNDLRKFLFSGCNSVPVPIK
jgi:cbb3-type cytochrome oxidase subunit 3